jgi:hypothetical protein
MLYVRGETLEQQETHQGTAVLERISSMLTAHLLSALLAPHVRALAALDHILLADVPAPRQTTVAEQIVKI